MNLLYDPPLNEYQQRQNALMSQQGWVIHHDMSHVTLEDGKNIHTHGLAENFGHWDLQIVAPLSYDYAEEVLTQIVCQIRSGKRFYAGRKYFIKCQQILFRRSVESGRNVLRLIFPDPHGCFDPDQMEKWAWQLDDLR